MRVAISLYFALVCPLEIRRVVAQAVTVAVRPEPAKPGPREPVRGVRLPRPILVAGTLVVFFSGLVVFFRKSMRAPRRVRGTSVTRL